MYLHKMTEQGGSFLQFTMFLFYKIINTLLEILQILN